MTGETEKEVSGWSVDTLRAHVQALLEERDLRYEQRYQAGQTALQAALTAERTAVNAALAAQERGTQAALVAAKEAVTKAEVATEKRFAAVNEFRQALSDTARLQVTTDKFDTVIASLTDRLRSVEQRVDKTEGKSTGGRELWAVLIGAAGIALAVIAFVAR